MLESKNEVSHKNIKTEASILRNPMKKLIKDNCEQFMEETTYQTYLI
jgi:hypothetical protein